MTSGAKLTEQQADAILRLAGETDADGNWQLTYKQIAKRLQISERTVRRWVREAAVKYGRLTAWRDVGVCDSCRQ